MTKRLDIKPDPRDPNHQWPTTVEILNGHSDVSDLALRCAREMLAVDYYLDGRICRYRPKRLREWINRRQKKRIPPLGTALYYTNVNDVPNRFRGGDGRILFRGVVADLCKIELNQKWFTRNCPKLGRTLNHCRVWIENKMKWAFVPERKDIETVVRLRARDREKNGISMPILASILTKDWYEDERLWTTKRIADDLALSELFTNKNPVHLVSRWIAEHCPYVPSKRLDALWVRADRPRHVVHPKQVAELRKGLDRVCASWSENFPQYDEKTLPACFLLDGKPITAAVARQLGAVHARYDRMRCKYLPKQRGISACRFMRAGGSPMVLYDREDCEAVGKRVVHASPKLKILATPHNVPEKFRGDDDAPLTPKEIVSSANLQKSYGIPCSLSSFLWWRVSCTYLKGKPLCAVQFLCADGFVRHAHQRDQCEIIAARYLRRRASTETHAIVKLADASPMKTVKTGDGQLPDQPKRRRGRPAGQTAALHERIREMVSSGDYDGTGKQSRIAEDIGVSESTVSRALQRR